MANLRHSILVRTDLNLPVGLLAAQIAHLHFETIRKRINTEDKTISFSSKKHEEDVMEWIKDPYLFVHRVPNIEALNYFYKAAADTNMLTTEWRDTIYLELSPTQKRAFEEVLIGVAFGPTDSDRIRSIIGDLPLL